MKIYFELKTNSLGVPVISGRTIDCGKRIQLNSKYMEKKNIQNSEQSKEETADQSNFPNE